MVVHDPDNTGEVAVNARCSFQFSCEVAASKKSSRGTIIFDPPFTIQASQRFWLDIDENRSSARYVWGLRLTHCEYLVKLSIWNAFVLSLWIFDSTVSAKAFRSRNRQLHSSASMKRCTALAFIDYRRKIEDDVDDKTSQDLINEISHLGRVEKDSSVILPDYTWCLQPSRQLWRNSGAGQSEEILVTSKLRLSSLQLGGGTLSFCANASLIQRSELRHSDRQTDSFTRVQAWLVALQTELKKSYE